MSAIIAAVGLALCGLAGKYAGERLCRDRLPFTDGPRSANAPAWLFAVGAAAVGAAVALHGANALQCAESALVVLALAAAAAADARCGIIPDLCTLLPLGAVVVATVWRHDAAPLISASIVAIPLAVAAWFSRGLGIGWGDVKLAAFAGAALGGRDTFVALFAAFLAVSLWSLLRRRTTEPAAFAPYFVTAIAVGIGIRATY